MVANTHSLISYTRTIMTHRQLQKSDRIVIIGAGVFGLSTALHLALRGYTNVTVFDRHDYDVSKYDYRSGADSASSGPWKSCCLSCAGAPLLLLT